MTDRPAPVTDPLRVDVVTIFPGMFQGPFDTGIVARARDRGAVVIAVHDLRDWTGDRHRSVDDTPYGGGAGMVMTAPPIVAAVEGITGADLDTARVIVLSASGRPFTQTVANALARQSRIVLVCGRYEGIDDRAGLALGADELSIGDYVLTGGELAAMVIVDAVTRLVPGVINAASTAADSHEGGLVEHPHYTRPETFRGLPVPPVLLGGNHAEIARWRRREALRRTAQRRPDLLPAATLSVDERAWAERGAVDRVDDDGHPTSPDAAGR